MEFGGVVHVILLKHNYIYNRISQARHEQGYISRWQQRLWKHSQLHLNRLTQSSLSFNP